MYYLTILLCYIFSTQLSLFLLKKFFYLRKDIVVNTRKEFKDPITGTCFEVDIWLPDFLLGFEYQVCSIYF